MRNKFVAIYTKKNYFTNIRNITPSNQISFDFDVILITNFFKYFTNLKNILPDESMLVDEKLIFISHIKQDISDGQTNLLRNLK